MNSPSQTSGSCQTLAVFVHKIRTYGNSTRLFSGVELSFWPLKMSQGSMHAPAAEIRGMRVLLECGFWYIEVMGSLTNQYHFIAGQCLLICCKYMLCASSFALGASLLSVACAFVHIIADQEVWVPHHLPVCLYQSCMTTPEHIIYFYMLYTSCIYLIGIAGMQYRATNLL